MVAMEASEMARYGMTSLGISSLIFESSYAQANLPGFDQNLCSSSMDDLAIVVLNPNCMNQVPHISVLSLFVFLKMIVWKKCSRQFSSKT